MNLKCNRSIMSIWRKIIGGTTGFAFGGPLGALLSGVTGHAIDKIKNKQKLPEEIALKQIGFTIGVIVLSAKMAKADGKVTQDEIKAWGWCVSLNDNIIAILCQLQCLANPVLMMKHYVSKLRFQNISIQKLTMSATLNVITHDLKK